MVNVVKLFMKPTTTASGSKFNAFYCYLQNKEGNAYIDVVKPSATNEGGTRPVSLRVKLPTNAPIHDKLKACLDKGMHFPLYVHLDAVKRTNDDKPYYFITNDKDKEGNLKLDKYGNKHYIIIIYDTDKIEQAPVKSLTLDDVFERE